MRKSLPMLLGALMALPTFARDFEYEYEGQTLTYTVIDEDAKTVTTKEGTSDNAGNNVSGELIIPEKAKDGDVEYTVASIADYAFFGCSDLTSVAIPTSVKSIGGGAFYDCNGLTKAEFGSIEHFCSIEFDSDTSNPLPYAHNLYINGEEIKELVIPNTISSIGKYAFSGYSGMTSVTIPNSVTVIGENAFRNCSGLTSVTIPNSVTSIDKYAFFSCSNLTSVTIGNSVTSIGRCAFQYCSSLTSVTIPNSVTSIGDFVFYDCRGLTSATIGNSVTSISNNAFQNCKSLTSVTIPKSVTEISKSAFSGCSSLPSVTIPNSVTSIYTYAFRNCSSLTSVTISSSVTTIENSAFVGCSGLIAVYYGAENPIEGSSEIFSDYTKATLYVPEGAVEKCKQINPWMNFAKIEAYDFSGIEEIIVDFDSEKPYEVFNLNGVLLGRSTDNLAPGIYIVRQNGRTHKAVVR